MALPSRAYASDGFLGGLQDLVGAREIEPVEDYEDEYQEGYEPQLTLDPPDPGTNTLLDLGEDATTVDYVNTTVDSFNKSGVSGDTSDNTMLGFLRTFFHARNNSLANRLLDLMLLPAIGMVFMWWGVRKTIKVVMSGFRKGSMNL